MARPSSPVGAILQRMLRQERLFLWAAGELRLGLSAAAGAQMTPEEEVAGPTGEAQSQEGTERRGVIPQEEMELLETPPFPGQLTRERQRGEGDRQAEQPSLPAEEAPGATQRAELEIGRERGGRHLLEALRPLQADPLCQLRVPFQELLDEGARGRAGLAGEVER